MSESEPGREREEPRAGQEEGLPPVAFPEAKVPEVRVPAPTGRTDFSEQDDRPRSEPASGPASGEPAAAEPGSAGGAAITEPKSPALHDVWGKVEKAERQEQPEAPDAEDVKVAPVPEEAPQWEGSLFEGGADDGEGDPKYVPAVPAGAAGPAKPGKPSSGNWQMPEWMADEAAADAKLGGSPRSSGEKLEDGGGRGRLALYGGVGLLVVALLAAGGVYLLKGRDDAAPAAKKGDSAARPPRESPVAMPPDKPLRTFSGRPSKVLGHVADPISGLSYPRLGPPWQLPTKQNKLGTSGWSGQQILVTERRGGQLWYGQLLTGGLAPTLKSSYRGPSSVKNVSGLAARGHEAQYYAFPHRSSPLASQALNVDGHKGWLVASYLTYKRSGVRATGEITATAVIDTGRPAPAVVFASLPNTHKRQWPDLNTFLTQLKIAG